MLQMPTLTANESVVTAMVRANWTKTLVSTKSFACATAQTPIRFAQHAIQIIIQQRTF